MFPRRSGRSWVALALAVALLSSLGYAVNWSRRNTTLGQTAWWELKQRYFQTVVVRSRRHLIQEYLGTHAAPKLQIGAGPHSLPGWLNSDIVPEKGQVYLDAIRPFPLPSASFQCVFAEQLIEHLSYEGASVMFRESHRILRPGGRIRIVTPDLSTLVAMFKKPMDPAARHFMDAQIAWTGLNTNPTAECFILNQFFSSWGHRFLYDPETLATALKAAGFRDIRQLAPRVTEDPDFEGVDSHFKVGGIELNDYPSMAFEATR
jgi:predicted SAM-dependent methyltransferase